MQNTRIVHFKSKKLSEIIKSGYVFALMFAAYIVGMVVAVLLLKENEKVFSAAVAAFGEFSDKRTGGFLSVFFSALVDSLPAMLAVFISGTCIVGAAIIPFFVFYRGFCYGLLAGYLYSQFAMNGIIYSLLFIIPPSLIGAFALFFSAKQSYGFSLLLAGHIFPEPRENLLYPHFVRYCKGFLLLLLLCVVAALTDSLLSAAFIDTVKL